MARLKTCNPEVAGLSPSSFRMDIWCKTTSDPTASLLHCTMDPLPPRTRLGFFICVFWDMCLYPAWSSSYQFIFMSISVRIQHPLATSTVSSDPGGQL